MKISTLISQVRMKLDNHDSHVTHDAVLKTVIYFFNKRSANRTAQMEKQAEIFSHQQIPYLTTSTLVLCENLFILPKDSFSFIAYHWTNLGTVLGSSGESIPNKCVSWEIIILRLFYLEIRKLRSIGISSITISNHPNLLYIFKLFFT